MNMIIKKEAATLERTSANEGVQLAVADIKRRYYPF